VRYKSIDNYTGPLICDCNSIQSFAHTLRVMRRTRFKLFHPARDSPSNRYRKSVSMCENAFKCNVLANIAASRNVFHMKFASARIHWIDRKIFEIVFYKSQRPIYYIIYYRNIVITFAISQMSILNFSIHKLQKSPLN